MLTKDVRTDSTRSASQPRGTIAVGGVEALDSAQAPGGDALAGELNGEIVAVITIRDGVVVANPFRATAVVLDRLRSHRALPLAQASGRGHDWRPQRHPDPGPTSAAHAVCGSSPPCPGSDALAGIGWQRRIRLPLRRAGGPPDAEPDPAGRSARLRRLDGRRRPAAHPGGTGRRHRRARSYARRPASR